MKSLQAHKICILLILLLSGTLANAQDTTIISRSGMAFNFMPLPAYGGITYDILIAKRLNLEAGVGLFGYGGGLNYYILKPMLKKINPYIGIKSNLTSMIHARTQVISYVPAGATLFGEHMFLSLDFGPALYDIKNGSIDDEREGLNVVGKKEFGFNGNIKFGIRFQILGREKIKKPWNDLFI